MSTQLNLPQADSSQGGETSLDSQSLKVPIKALNTLVVLFNTLQNNPPKKQIQMTPCYSGVPSTNKPTYFKRDKKVHCYEHRGTSAHFCSARMQTHNTQHTHNTLVIHAHVNTI